MTISQKIEKLNRACNYSLSINYLFSSWQCHSYRDNSPLNGKYIEDKTFEECIEKAYKSVFDKKEEE